MTPPIYIEVEVLPFSKVEPNIVEVEVEVLNKKMSIALAPPF